MAQMLGPRHPHGEMAGVSGSDLWTCRSPGLHWHWGVNQEMKDILLSFSGSHSPPPFQRKNLKKKKKTGPRRSHYKFSLNI